MTQTDESGAPGTQSGSAAISMHSKVDRNATRRVRLHHVFVRRRRWSRELDHLCGIDRSRKPVPYAAGGMTLGYLERDRAGCVA